MIDFNSLKNSGLDLGIADGNIAMLQWDQQESQQNYCSEDFFNQLLKILVSLQKRTDLKGLIFTSSKDDCFFCDYSWDEIRANNNKSGYQANLLNTASDCLNLLETMPFPTVVGVNGPCVGSGFEFILAFDYRIGCDNRFTTFSLPGINMGISPVLGTASRLPRICGIDNALEMIASGSTYSASSMMNNNILDEIINSDFLVTNANNLVKKLFVSQAWKARRIAKATVSPISQEQRKLVRAKFLSKSFVQNESGKKSVINFVVNSCCQSAVDSQASNVDAFVVAWKSNYVRNSFTLEETRSEIVHSKQIGEAVIPNYLDNVGVIGSGSIGPSLALLMAKRGVPSLLIDVAEFNLGLGTTAIMKLLQFKLRNATLTIEELLQVLGRLSTSTVLESIKDRKVILEAIIENEDAKVELLHQLNSMVSEGTIICSNSASIPLKKLAAQLKDPTNFAGLHFCPPLIHPNMVEIIRTDLTSDECVATLVGLCIKLQKVPIVVNDSPGFLINRLLLVLLRETQELVVEGMNPYLVDEATVRFGFPKGIFDFTDLTGIDNLVYLNTIIDKDLGNRFPPPIINKWLLEKGRLGQKSKLGYYKYSDTDEKSEDPEFLEMLKTIQKGSLSLLDEEIMDRLLIISFVEANRILGEKVVPTPNIVDLALNLTLGFPKEWGGIFKWAELQGWDKIISLINKYSYLGERVTPCAYLTQKISEKSPYYFK
jgi:3-hydroxyacyl-CoA dehydrogenase/enoyl-CoA hydratase/carnithine racemase